MLKIKRIQNMKLLKVKADLLAIVHIAFLPELKHCLLFLFALHLR
jgi:hypothetical protein